MRLVTPERWYIAFWILMGLGFLTGFYLVIKYATLAALRTYWG